MAIRLKGGAHKVGALLVFFVLSVLVEVRPAFSGPSLVVNIDNPNFRKILAATPLFFLDPKSASPEGVDMAAQGSNEFSRLLNFSGLFNTMDSAAFKDIMVKANERWYVDSSIKSVDLTVWKTISVEALTLGMLSQNNGQWTLTIRTIDIARGEIIAGKKYSNLTKAQLIPVIRRYADVVMKAYTGKSGIFNSKLTFIGRTSANASKQVYISDFDGSNAYPITKGNVPHLSPSWSTDGRSIVYTSYQDGNPDLFIYSLATGKSRKLSGMKGINSGGNFSPNGNVVAFTGSVNGDADIYMIPPSGGTRRLLISGNGLDVDPTFSPDGKSIAFASGRFGNPHLFVAQLQWAGDGGVKVLSDKRVTYAGWYNATPAWSPESDRLAFAGYDKEIDRFDLFLVNPDGTKLERLTLRAGDNERPWFSPNGQNLVFMSNRTNGQNVKSVHQLFIMNRDGSNQRQLSTGLYEAQTPSWGPNDER
jgi:TolB protein